MPYFCFSTYYEDGPKEDGPKEAQKQHKFAEMKKEYDRLDDSGNFVVHGSPTLDEWYYQFATDDSSKEERDRRNKSQVVTGAMKGRETTKAIVQCTEEGKRKPGEWTLIRVSQLWAWTISDSAFDALLVSHCSTC